MPRLLFAILLLAVATRAQISPLIQITSLSPYGDTKGVISGSVVGLLPGNYKVAVMVFLPGLGFYSKPHCNPPTVPLLNGTFAADITTGGIDPLATLIAVLVFPVTATVDCVSDQYAIPEHLESQAIAKRFVPRPNPNEAQVQFAGDTWSVKTSPVRVSPGNNYFCDSPENVWVDTQGRLHLRITFRNNKWCAAEVVSRRVLGYGKYTVQLATPPALDANVIFGAFTWADAERVTREIDLLELLRESGDTHNAQYVVQPWDVPSNRSRFFLPSIAPTIHTLEWRPNSAYFRSADVNGNVLHDWGYGFRPPVPDSDRLNFRFNLWLRNGASPANGQEAEVIVSAFAFEPAPGVCPGGLNPSSILNVTENGETGRIALSVAPSCMWIATSNSSWAQVYPLAGMGPRSLDYTVFPNFRATMRQAAFHIAGQLFGIQQAAGIGNQDRRFMRLLYYFHYGRLPSESEIAFHLGTGLTRAQMHVTSPVRMNSTWAAVSSLVSMWDCWAAMRNIAGGCSNATPWPPALRTRSGWSPISSTRPNSSRSTAL